jgi:hypothetical protein
MDYLQRVQKMTEREQLGVIQKYLDEGHQTCELLRDFVFINLRRADYEGESSARLLSKAYALLAQNPNRFEGFLAFAEISFRTSNYGAAVAYATKALELCPGDPAQSQIRNLLNKGTFGLQLPIFEKGMSDIELL